MLKPSRKLTPSPNSNVDAQAAADIAKRVQAVQAEAGGRNLRTAGGKVVGLEGPPHPSAWDSRNGIVLRRQKPSTNRRLGRTSPRSVTRRSRLFVGTRLRWCSEFSQSASTFRYLQPQPNAGAVFLEAGRGRVNTSKSRAPFSQCSA
jgi:hypothetical protein